MTPRAKVRRITRFIALAAAAIPLILGGAELVGNYQPHQVFSPAIIPLAKDVSLLSATGGGAIALVGWLLSFLFPKQ
jgi:hypothetical protein